MAGALRSPGKARRRGLQRGCRYKALGWLGRPEGEDCALKACMGGELQSQERTWICSDVLAVGGALWRPGVSLTSWLPLPPRLC